MPINLVGDWYTDTADVYRTVNVKSGAVTKQVRKLIRKDMPCRVYQTGNPRTQFKNDASEYSNRDLLACETNEDITAGDEIQLFRGGRIGKSSRMERYFAGAPTDYFEPFGGVFPKLDHKQVPLGGTNRTKLV